MSDILALASGRSRSNRRIEPDLPAKLIKPEVMVRRCPHSMEFRYRLHLKGQPRQEADFRVR